MKCYLTLLRHDGKRLAADRVQVADRLVTLHLKAAHGVRCLSATCSFGGETVAELWDPVLARISSEDLTIRGIEHRSDAGLVQEWRLRPHVVEAWRQKGQNA